LQRQLLLKLLPSVLQQLLCVLQQQVIRLMQQLLPLLLELHVLGTSCAQRSSSSLGSSCDDTGSYKPQPRLRKKRLQLLYGVQQATNFRFGRYDIQSAVHPANPSTCC
jgi:hypothetical protein